MTPGECREEERTADIGGVKSFCSAMGKWTNCREVGHCVYEGQRKQQPGQMTIFDVLEDEE